MRQQFTQSIESGRIITGPMASNPGDRYGQFLVIGPYNIKLLIIACAGEVAMQIAKEDGLDIERFCWDHVSVSVPGTKNTPDWKQMCWVKDNMFDDDETVMQFHPPKDKYVNIHNGCLHLWRRCIDAPAGPQTIPPIEMV